MRPQIFAPGRWSAGNWVAAALALAVAASVAGIVIGTVNTDHRDEVWLEVAKAGVQMVAVGLIGGAVAAAWRYREHERDIHEKQRDRDLQIREKQLSVFRQVVESYNEVKAVRRTLRSLGLGSVTGALSEVQVSGFREQMQQLNVVQLRFEALKRELGETDIFGTDTLALVEELREMEHYLNGVLSVWERSGSLIESGSDGTVVSSQLNGLIGYTSFKTGVVNHRRKITELIHEQLFGPLSESTKQKLTEIDAEEDETEQAGNTEGVR